MRQLASAPVRRQGFARFARRICNWFTEGFDMAHLKNAKALLDELNAQRPDDLLCLGRRSRFRLVE